MGSPIILKVSSLEKGAGFHLPTSQADIVTPDSPAIEVMTDLKQIVADTIATQARVATIHNCFRYVLRLMMCEDG